jgi:hypothetical protein
MKMGVRRDGLDAFGSGRMYGCGSGQFSELAFEDSPPWLR